MYVFQFFYIVPIIRGEEINDVIDVDKFWDPVVRGHTDEEGYDEKG